MRNFKSTFIGIIRFQLLFIILSGTAAFSQNNNYAESKPILNKTSIKDVLYITENYLHKTSLDIITNVEKTSFKTSNIAIDTEAPVLTCPANQELAFGSLVPNYFGLLSATDNIDTLIDVTQNPGEGSTFYDGMEIKFTATDKAGNISKCSLFVTAISSDLTPPTFTCPTGLTLNRGDKIPNYAEKIMMNLKDNGSIALKYTMAPEPGSDFYDGIPIQIEYLDKSGNRSICNFTVAMAAPDETHPVITSYPDNQSIDSGTVLPDYREFVEATDDSSQKMTISQIPAPGSPIIPHMTVTMTVKDASNNETSCCFKVDTFPTITKPKSN